MAQADLDDGQSLRALNEIFVGHRSHQSARYQIACEGRSERQSSSGVIVSTGTGATGWACSIQAQRGHPASLPTATERALFYQVREAFPSVATGTTLTQGRLEEAEVLGVTSELDDGGVIFGDGIEDDFLAFGWGMTVTVRVATDKLRLVRE